MEILTDRQLIDAMASGIIRLEDLRMDLSEGPTTPPKWQVMSWKDWPNHPGWQSIPTLRIALQYLGTYGRKNFETAVQTQKRMQSAMPPNETQIG